MGTISDFDKFTFGPKTTSKQSKSVVFTMSEFDWDPAHKESICHLQGEDVRHLCYHLMNLPLQNKCMDIHLL